MSASDAQRIVSSIILFVVVFVSYVGDPKWP